MLGPMGDIDERRKRLEELFNASAQLPLTETPEPRRSAALSVAVERRR
jgi:hypothetical protein